MPVENSRDRLWRTGLLAEILANRGHEVIWWTSGVDHFRKTLFVKGEPRVPVIKGLSIQFLSGRLYHRNVSIKRWLNHAELARRFVALASDEPRPNVILCSFPTIELSREAARYGRAHDIPVILDVRDLWPDIFLDVLPKGLRKIGKLALARQFRDASRALASCDGLFAVSEGYLEWGLTRAKRPRNCTDAVFPLGYRLLEWSRSDEQNLVRRLDACGVKSDLPMVTFVGTFGRTYDLRTVIDAVRSMRKQTSEPLQFIFCGTGEREQEWRKAAEGVPGIAFTGWLAAGELSCLLSRSTVGLAAYAARAPQGIPNKVIEYMAAGLPMLCSLPGESRELLESSGFGRYYRAGDPHSLIAGLKTIMEDTTGRERMSVAAGEVFERRFSANAVYNRMADRLERQCRNRED